MRRIARKAAEAFRGVYKVTLSSDPVVVKKLILNLAYKLHLGYEDAKARLTDPEGSIDPKKLADLHTVIRTSKTGDELETLEKLRKTELSEFNKIDVINNTLERYASAYDMISNAVAGIQIDDKHFAFQLPDRAVKGLDEKGMKQIEMYSMTPEEFNRNRAKIKSVTFEERDYICVTLGDNEASKKAPADWYNQELGGHLIVGGPVIAPKSTNISNGTPSPSSTSRNNNTKEEMEAEMREEKNKG